MWSNWIIIATSATAVLLSHLYTNPYAYQSIGNDAPVFDSRAIESINQARGLEKRGKYSDASDLLEPIARKGHPIALYHLARQYKNGLGRGVDLDHARALFLESVRHPSPMRAKAAYELGRLYQRTDGRDCQNIAFNWFRKSLGWGSKKAHVQLAKHYEFGLGVRADIGRALHHYRLAGIAGYPTSTIRLARIFRQGLYGLSTDEEKAQFWADRAILGLMRKARLGSASAAKTMGRLFRDGEFVEKSFDDAKSWFEHASRLGDPGAMHDLGMLLINTASHPQMASDGIEWLRRASKRAHGGAMTALGRLHLKELHDLKKPEAREWFERGVLANHPGAMEELARLYARGVLVPQNTKRARKLAEKGANLGHSGSKRLLNILLAEQLNERSNILSIDGAS